MGSSSSTFEEGNGERAGAGAADSVVNPASALWLAARVHDATNGGGPESAQFHVPGQSLLRADRPIHRGEAMLALFWAWCLWRMGRQSRCAMPAILLIGWKQLEMSSCQLKRRYGVTRQKHEGRPPID